MTSAGQRVQLILNGSRSPPNDDGRDSSGRTREHERLDANEAAFRAAGERNEVPENPGRGEHHNVRFIALSPRPQQHQQPLRQHSPVSCVFAQERGSGVGGPIGKYEEDKIRAHVSPKTRKQSP